MKKLSELLNSLKDYWQFLSFVGLVAAAIYSPSSPDLRVSWSISPLLLEVKGAPEKAPEVKNSQQVVFTLTLENLGEKTLTIQDVRVYGVRAISGVGASSTAEYLNDKAREMERYLQLPDESLKFPGLTEIPKGQTVKIQIAGNLYRMVFQRVAVLSNAEKQQVMEREDITGITLFLHRYFSILFLVIAVFLLLLGAKRQLSSRSNREHV